MLCCNILFKSLNNLKPAVKYCISFLMKYFVETSMTLKHVNSLIFSIVDGKYFICKANFKLTILRKKKFFNCEKCRADWSDY